LALKAEELIPIRRIVDELLLDFGRYEPLELLQCEGRLMYADYEVWRRGEADNLDDLLIGDIGEIKKRLETAVGYAKEQKLEQESLEYPGWGTHSQKMLEAHSDPQLNRLIGTLWQPPAERPQMDLFMDSPALSLGNGLRDSLANGDPDSARKLLEQLYDLDAGHPELAMFEQLVLAQERAAQPVTNIAEELEWLQSDISPAAHEVLKRRASDFSAPLWQRLSIALADHPFDSEQPNMHLSYTAMQTQDWHTTLSAIESEPDWSNQPILLIRRMNVCSKLHDEAASHLSCFLLCWQFPDSLATAFNDFPASLLKSEWHRFQALEASLETDQFPAWLLIRYPALSKSLAEKTESLSSHHYISYKLIHRLQNQRGTPLDDEQLNLRKRLQQENTDLFRYYLATQK
jgi:hypothetical protein